MCQRRARGGKENYMLHFKRIRRTKFNYKKYYLNWGTKSFISDIILEQLSSVLCRHMDLKEKWSHFDLKSWVTGGTKIRPVIPSNWKIFESNWLSISSQFDSNILQLLRITGRILVPPVTQLFRSKWLIFSFSDLKMTLVDRVGKLG